MKRIYAWLRVAVLCALFMSALSALAIFPAILPGSRALSVMNAQEKGGRTTPTPTPATTRTSPKKPAPATAAKRSRPKPSRPSENQTNNALTELAFWQAIKDSSNPDDFKEYLKKYPQGEFAGLAENRLKTLEARAKSESTSTKKSPSAGTVVRHGIGMEFVWIPPGSFMMGSENGKFDEKPVHRVTLSNGFDMGRYEVTHGQWRTMMGTTVQQQRDKRNTSWPMAGEGDTYPMYYVSWEEAKDFVQRLNSLNDGYLYRLPTEAEWEYACRAGTTGDYAGDLDSMAWYGNNSGNSYIDLASVFLQPGQDSESAWQNDQANYRKRLLDRLKDNGNRTHTVGTKQANGFGLYDMHGNVFEWCEDWYHSGYDGAPTDGSAWLTGGEQKYRVLRGGSWPNFASSLRSAYRNFIGTPDVRDPLIGFRVVAVARTQ